MAAAAAAAATQNPDSARSFGRKLSIMSDASISRQLASEISVIGSLSLVNLVDFPDEECLVVRLSHDKTLWAVGLANGRIQLHTTESCTLVYSLDPPQRQDKETVTSLNFLPVDQSASQKPEKQHLLLASYATGQVRLWHYAGVTNQLLWTLTEDFISNEEEYESKQQKKSNQILCLSCSPDGQRFVTGGTDSVIRVYDLKRRSILTLCQSSLSASQIDGHRNRICSILYHPLGKYQPGDYGHIFVSGGWDNTVQIWDDRKPHSLWVYFGPHVCGTDAIDLDPLQNHVLTGSWERHKAMLQVWRFNDDAVRGRVDFAGKDAQTEMLRAKPIGELQQDPLSTPSMGYVAQWLSDQYMIFGGSNANVLKIVDRGTLNIVGSVTDFPKGVYSVASLQPDGADNRKPYKLAVCSGSRLYVFRFERK